MFKRIHLCFDVPALCWAAKVTCGILMSCVVIREERSGEITPLHFTSVGRIVDIPLRRRWRLNRWFTLIFSFANNPTLSRTQNKLNHRRQWVSSAQKLFKMQQLLTALPFFFFVVELLQQLKCWISHSHWCGISSGSNSSAPLIFHLCRQFAVCQADQDKAVSGRGCRNRANALSELPDRNLWETIHHKIQRKKKRKG